MPSEDKVVAAILACEAVRQKSELLAKAGGPRGRDIPAEILSFYRQFLVELAKPENQPKG